MNDEFESFADIIRAEAKYAYRPKRSLFLNALADSIEQIERDNRIMRGILYNLSLEHHEKALRGNPDGPDTIGPDKFRKGR